MELSAASNQHRVSINFSLWTVKKSCRQDTVLDGVSFFLQVHTYMAFADTLPWLDLTVVHLIGCTT